MNLVRPVKVTKVRQAHAAQKLHKPGIPYNGPNLIAQNTESAKKAARKTSARKGTKSASR